MYNDTMNNPKISIIASIGRNRELGRGNDLIWRSKEDMQHFMDTTMGHPVIMGRKTYESIPAKYRPLKGRENIVITRNPEWKPEEEGVQIFNSIEDALKYARSKDTEEVFVAGGGQIYSTSLPFTDRMYLTLIDDTVPDSDTFFPDYPEFKTEVSREEITTDKGLRFSWVVLEK
ncbi:diacylglycerol kinase [Candidatus Wolfebacteria bacterium]|nr:MAG: diacylglycerol kinase [Candidatus Wolfebacteria bacterium]